MRIQKENNPKKREKGPYIEIYSYKIPFKAPLHLKSGKVFFRKGLLLNIDGVWGEIAPLEGFSKESLKDALIQTIKICKGEKEENLFPSVSFGFCSALNGKKYQLPASYSYQKANLGIEKDSNTSYTKIKLHHFDVEKSIQTIQHILKKHPNIRLRIDCNKSWSLDEAFLFAKQFTKDTFDYLEEPLKNPEELIEFYKTTEFPIALDESVYQKKGVSLNLLQQSAIKTLILKPMMIGGIKELSFWIDFAKEKDIQIVFSSSFESSIGIKKILGLANYFSITTPLGIDTLKFFDKDAVDKTLLKKEFATEKKQDRIVTSFDLTNFSLV